MNHSIIVRPAPDFTPTVAGILLNHVEIADGVTIRTESTEYLRALRDALNARLAIAEAVTA